MQLSQNISNLWQQAVWSNTEVAWVRSACLVERDRYVLTKQLKGEKLLAAGTFWEGCMAMNPNKTSLF